MKHFRRKRTTSTTSPPPPNPLSISVSIPAPLAPVPQPDTPLYARFTTHHSQAGTGSKPVVSGPIALAPRRAGQVPVHVPAAGPPSRGPSPQKEREVVREERKGTSGREGLVTGERVAGGANEDEVRWREKEREREVKRMPSHGEALLGRSGERVEGERVLLPARKRTVKRVGDEKEDAEVRTKEIVEERPEKDNLPLRDRTLDERLSSPDDRILLPSHKVTQKRAEDGAAEWPREGRRQEASPVKESEPGEGIGEVEPPRVKGPRVVVPPPRTVSRKKIEVQGDANAPSSSRRTAEDSRPREVHQEPPFTSSPAFASGFTHHGSASTRAVVIGSPPPSDGWEDKFSTPKQMYGNTFAAHASAFPSSGKPLRPLPDPLNACNRPTNTQKATTSPSNVSSATAATHESSSSVSTSRDLDDRPRVVGDRVLLPARKVTHRHAENIRENDTPPERGRTLSTKRHARLSRDVGSDVSAVTSSGLFVASAVSAPSNDLSYADGNRAILDDSRVLPEVMTPPLARPDASSIQLPPRPPPKSEFIMMGPATSSKSVFAGTRLLMERAKSSEGETASNVSSGSGATATTSNTTSKSSSSTETNGRPPRRRKYSLLAAFGLPMSRTTSESETSTGPTMQSTKTPTATPSSAPSTPPLSVPPPSAPYIVRPVLAASFSTDSGAGLLSDSRQRLASAAGRSPPDVQLHSLHLSGFDFPFDALLTDSQRAPDDIPIVPTSAQPPQSPKILKRRSLAIAVDPPPAVASTSDPDPPAAASRTPASVSASPSPTQNSNSRDFLPNSPPSAPPRKTSPVPADPPAHQAPELAPAQKLGTKPTSRGIDPDHSLLSPESDTRYPLPRRSSTNQSSRSRPHKSSSHPNGESPSRSSPTHSSPGEQESPNMLPAPTQRGPMQGRPLIFAAMAAAEAEAEIIDPKAWMAIATAEMQVLEADRRPVQTEHSNGSSQFVNGYPTPRSSSPRLPTASPDSRQGGRSVAAMGGSIGEPSGAPWLKEQRIDPRHPSPSYPQNPPMLPGNIRAPSETQSPRPHKLSKSKSRVSRMTEASQPVTQPHLHSHSNGHSGTLGAKPPTPVEDAPPVRTREGPSKAVAKLTHASSHGVLTAPSAASLGSPFQMRSEKVPVDRRPSEASRSPPSRVISSESPVPTRPVKVLTERQLEKLSATKGMYGDALNAGHSAQRRHEQPPPLRSPPSRVLPPTPHTSPDESPALQTPSNGSTNGVPSRPATPPQTHHEDPTVSTPEKVAESELPRSPSSPEDYARARSQRRGKALEKDRPEGIENVTPTADPEPEEPKEPTFYPLEKHIAEATLFGQLLGYLSFGDWLALSSVSKTIRTTLYENRDHTERVLERYLRVVGYTCWAFLESEPLALTLTDLNAYMHGVSIPAHQFSRYAETYLEMKGRREWDAVQSLAAACRAFTRVVLRLRAQAEAEARVVSAVARERTRSPLRGWGGSTTSLSHISHQHAHPTHKSHSRNSSRAPSPTSMFSRSHHGHPGHSRNGSFTGHVIHHSQSVAQLHGPGQENGTGAFQSPLFRLRRAPLLQVCVPSPEGDWLSDASVLECEQELKRAGVLHLLRPGDVVWDTAVGDEGNVGRLVWDGSYLIDLDYTYSRAGDLPKYLPTMSFPPSYFHRVIRTMGSGNPICHIDISPWGEEVAANLQLLQDRMKTETPQGGHHMVVRWVHRSSFTIRPSSIGKPVRISVPKGVGPGPSPGGAWLVDPGWFGTVVVEAEGTNEGLADLQDRCRGAFPVRAMGANPALNVSPERAARMEERRSVFRILRERSRPGEIWIKTVTDKERLLPP